MASRVSSALSLSFKEFSGHGRSNANAIKNAVRVAKEFYESGINTNIAKQLGDSAKGEESA